MVVVERSKIAPFLGNSVVKLETEATLMNSSRQARLFRNGDLPVFPSFIIVGEACLLDYASNLPGVCVWSVDAGIRY